MPLDSAPLSFPMNRRQFIQNTAVIAPAAMLAPNFLFEELRKMKKLGIQLFSIPKMLDQDFRKSMEMLQQMGYTEIEMFGPFPFSDPATIANWEAMTPMLGFKGSGYFGQTPQQVKAIFNEYGMTTPSVHTDFETLKTRMDQLGEAASVLGFEYVVLPAIPDAERKTLDDYRRVADTFNKIGESAKKNGLKFGYHNHGYGLHETEGVIPLNLILDNTDPGLVFFEMDLFWTAAGGADPVEYLTNYPKRYHALHIKDMKEKKRFSGDGNDARQWYELFPYMTSCGEGVMDLKGIMAAAAKASVKHYFVEQDLVADPDVSLKKSADYLLALK